MCNHSLAEQDTEVFDGVCPICLSEKNNSAIDLIIKYGGIDGSHHKQWVLDQVLRVLSERNYSNLIKEYCGGEDGEFTYSWDEGIAP